MAIVQERERNEVDQRALEFAVADAEPRCRTRRYTLQEMGRLCALDAEHVLRMYVYALGALACPVFRLLRPPPDSSILSLKRDAVSNTASRIHPVSRRPLVDLFLRQRTVHRTTLLYSYMYSKLSGLLCTVRP